MTKAKKTKKVSVKLESKMLSEIGGEEMQLRCIDLKQAEYNPRKITDKEMAELKQSIRNGGFTQRIVVNSFKGRENVVIAGHQRLRALMEMGVETAPCIVVCYEPDREREMNIRYNKSGGGWDWDVMGDNFNSNELLGWGFEDFKISAMNGGSVEGGGLSGGGDGSGDDGVTVEKEEKEKTIKMSFEMTSLQHQAVKDKLDNVSDDGPTAALLILLGLEILI